MNLPADSPSPLVRFLDSFLQERNIKWILAVGMAILLGSSLMMVTSHWQAIGDIWKYLILLGYVGAIDAIGHWSYHRFALTKTGTVLMALTVLLIPMSFVAWHLFVLRTRAEGLGQAIGITTAAALLVPNIVFALAAARRIFHHFLRGPQPTFLASYVVLALAGAVAPTVSQFGATAGIVASLLMWVVFVAGAVKVNRHVFWLTEEHNAPRICGFLPALLLGSEFLGVFAANFASELSLPWFGFGLVLIAIPVLLTADAVAGVFQQRTGGLVRPLPWSIALPLALGTVLCLVGVAFAMTQLFVPPYMPYAMVPTAALAAVVMIVVARRTGETKFVWVMLAGVMLAYNFSPVFFRELAHQILDLGARAVGEDRLPYAFYGLTYLPLIGTLMAAAVAAARRGSQLFAIPLRQCSIGLSTMLLLASFTHPQLTLYPTFAVGLVMTGLFALQAVLFRDRRLVGAALISWLIMSTGCGPFLSHVFGAHLPAGSTIFGAALGAAVLLLVGRWLDPYVALLPWPGPSDHTDEAAIAARSLPMCQLLSLMVSSIAAVVWFAQYGLPFSADRAWPVALLLSALLIVHSLKWIHTGLSAFVYAYFAATATSLAIVWAPGPATVVTLATVVLISQWLVDYGFTCWPDSRLARAYATVNRVTAFSGLALLLLLVYVPVLTYESCVPRFHSNFSRICFLFVTVWAFDAARRFRHRALTFAGCLAALVLAGAVWIDVAPAISWARHASHHWLPAVWAATACAAIPAGMWLRVRRKALESRGEGSADGLRAISLPLDLSVRFVLAAIAILSLMGPDWPLRAAGALALAGLYALAETRQLPTLRTRTLVLANWHAMAVVAALTVANAASSWIDLVAHAGLTICLPLALAAAASAVAWQVRPATEGRTTKDLVQGHTAMCLGVAGLGLTASLALHSLGLAEFLMAAASFALIAGCECRNAVLQGDERRVWSAESVVLLAVAYFTWFQLVLFGRGIVLFAVLGVGFTAYAIGRGCSSSTRWNVFSRPFTATGLSLPVVTAILALGRHVVYSGAIADPAWFGVNTLAMFLAAGFYFWRAMESRGESVALHGGLLVLSSAIVNAALAMLWLDLEWTDPQLFMVPIGASILWLVEALRKDIPRRMHDPLRYVGALTILVSPTFEILGGSWIHLLSLMVLSVAIILVAIGVRVRVLVYTGTAFLGADLIAMVVRGSVDHPNLLWLAGVACGAAVIGLGAFCENNREKLLQRIRLLSAEIETWN